ncbi:MAG: lysophospholipid acyltransferase family protein [Aquificota bacterium]|nr:lysophospholipid acyltransferase family protein [Aquificota bacterium]
MGCPSTFPERYLLKPLCPVAKPLFRAFLRVKVYGLENVPEKGGYIVASNHRSHLDPPVLNSVFPEPLFFVAKEELFKPPLGFILRHMRAIPVKRGSGDLETLERVRELLEEGCSVCIFPEGTRAGPGEFLRPKSGVGFLAVRTGSPVVPVYIDGTDRVLPKGSRVPKPGHLIRVFIGKPKVYREKDNLRSYRSVAEDVMERIRSLAGNPPRPS